MYIYIYIYTYIIHECMYVFIIETEEDVQAYTLS